MLDIYPARELPIQGVSSKWLLDKINLKRKKLVTKDNLITTILEIDNPVLVTMGAGDIDIEVNSITKTLQNA